MIATLLKVEESATESRKDPKSHDKAKEFLDLGMALTYQMCSQFMIDVTQKRQERHFGRDFASNLNTAISAALNLTKSSNLVTGTSSAIFGGIDSVFQSWDKHYVATVDMAAAEALMQSNMATQAKANLIATNLTFSQADSRLIEYFNTCSFNGIRRLVNQSVVAASTGGLRVNSGAATQDFSAHQAIAFQALALCKWDDARIAFDAADAKKFGVNFRYGNALRKDASANLVVQLSNELGDPTNGGLPADVIAEMNACNVKPKVEAAKNH